MLPFGSGLRNALELARPFWRSEQRWRNAALLGTIIALTLSQVGMLVVISYWQLAFFNAFELKDWNRFIALLLWGHSTPKDGFTFGFLLMMPLFVTISVYVPYLRQALQIRWRQWMTHRYVDEWLADRTYFRMTLLNTGTDNPDQRIAEDVRLFVDNSLLLGLGLVQSMASLFFFVFLLWKLSDNLVVGSFVVHGYLVWVALLYAALGSGLAHLLGRRLIPLHFQQQKAEADYRFSLMRLNECAEGVAFHGGEAEQQRELSDRFGLLAANWRAIMQVTKRLTFGTTGYRQIVFVFPLTVSAPAYFASRITLGVVFQISNAFLQVQGALSWFVDNYAVLTDWLATVDRLASFCRAMREVRRRACGLTVLAAEDGGVALEGVDLALPDGSKLLHGLRVRIAPGERVLLRGPSGSGKSTLFRAFAGIWPFGHGSIRTPSTGSSLFLPQRPYMPLGTLKRVACFPRQETDFSDHEVRAALCDVGLEHLGGELSTVDTWDRRLSDGEQQRLAATRALLLRPAWCFLDEATSALDHAAQTKLYELLLRRLPNTAFVSIAHRQELEKHHPRVLTIDRGRVHDSATSRETVGP